MQHILTAVDPFLVNFAIPSGLPNSDPDENSVNVGLFASVIGPANTMTPTKPELSSPLNAAMNVNPFSLQCAMCNITPTDGDGQDVNYTALQIRALQALQYLVRLIQAQV